MELIFRWILIFRWTAFMSDWAMSPPCCKTLDLFGKRSLQIHCLGIYILPESWLWQKRSNLPNFRKNEFISLYNFLPWYALANVLLIVGGIKVFSFSIRELFESLKDMCVILFPRRSEVCFWSGWWLRWALPLLPSLSSYIAIVQLQLLPLPLLYWYHCNHCHCLCLPMFARLSLWYGSSPCSPSCSPTTPLLASSSPLHYFRWISSSFLNNYRMWDNTRHEYWDQPYF